MMLEAIIDGLAALATPQSILFMLIGVVYGLVIGILPGLGGVVAMALLLPFTYGFETAATLALLLGAHIATIWGDSVTSILFSVPGSAKGLALCFDGYPMTKQGQARRALAASATGTMRSISWNCWSSSRTRSLLAARGTMPPGCRCFAAVSIAWRQAAVTGPASCS